MAEDIRPRLGRGLAALIGDSAPDRISNEKGHAQRRIPIEFIKPNPRNPRRSFDDGLLAELAESIREKGVIQPILVRAIPNTVDAFEIIAGERRWRAAQIAGIHDVPVVIVEADDKQSLEIAIIENVQRSDLNAIEEALGYEQLARDFSYSQSDVAKIIGKSRSHIANTLRLLKLPQNTRDLLSNGTLSAGHARALLSVQDPEAVARQIVEQGLTVRDVERIAQDEVRQQSEASSSQDVPKPRAQKDADTRALEKALNDVLGMTVAIKHKGESGEVAIRYKSLEQLDALCQRLKS